jgi:ATP-binding cassette subfamily B (MDR/TAP) protein 1
MGMVPNSLSEYADVYEYTQSYVLYFVYVGVAVVVFGYLQLMFWNWASERQMLKIRKLFFQSVMRQEIGWFDTHEGGELSSRFAE